MNILIIPSWYSTSDNPTNGSFFKEQAEALKESGNNVIVAFVEVRLLSKTNKKEKVQIINDNGIKTYRIIQGKIPKTGNVGTAIAFKQGMKKIYREIKLNEKIDLVHLHSCIWGGLSGVYITKKLSVPFIITEHSSYYGRFKVNLIEKQLIKYSLKKADKVIAVSNYLKEILLKHYNGDIEVVPNMVDCSQFLEAKVNKSNNKKFSFLSLCYLKKNKRVDILIEAFSKYFKSENAQLIIAGDGPERLALEKLATDLNIKDKVIFKGSLSREEVKVEMNKCNLFVLSSVFETFGVVLIEALSSGKPVVSTKNGGANDIVNDLNGVLANIEDSDDLGAKMHYMYINYDNYNSITIREDCINRYSKDIIIQKLINIYSQTICK
ncbi:MAG: glycosyltransferase family 4 protein [Clostridium sartagoforme]|nr:glycosyltransferase family 4 protein [Clostridium sartagoforme]